MIGILCSCVSPYIAANIPCNQPGTMWSTADGTVTFSVEEKASFVQAQIITEAGAIDIVIAMSATTSDLHIAYKNDFDSMKEEDPFPHFALWRYQEVEKDHFVVEVLHTVYFQPGEILTFYKAD